MPLPFGDMHLLLNMKAAPDGDMVAKIISQVRPTFLKNILLQHPSGLYVLPSPSMLNVPTRMDPEIIQMLLVIMQKAFDFVIIDGGKFPADMSNEILEISDEVLIVTELSKPCIVNVRKFLSIFRKPGFFWKEKIKILVNRYQKDSSMSLNEAEQKMCTEIFWKIPNDFQAMMNASNQGKMLSALGKRNGTYNCFIDLATFFLRNGRMESRHRKALDKNYMEIKDKGKWLGQIEKLFLRPGN
jgi:pilus assembly protein CpaE